MRSYKRVEIKAFRRRVYITPGSDQYVVEEGIELFDSDSETIVEIDSPEGREILAETVRLLTECIPDVEQPTESGPMM